MINKFMVIAGGVGVIGLGALGFSAFQSHAQIPTTKTNPSIVNTTQVKDISSPSDTDNIQNDVGGIDKPDTVVSSTNNVKDISSPSDTDNIQNDVGGIDKPDTVNSTSTVEKGTHENGENTTSDIGEVEDSK